LGKLPFEEIGNLQPSFFRIAFGFCQPASGWASAYALRFCSPTDDSLQLVSELNHVGEGVLLGHFMLTFQGEIK
jgi:hypothetical protein